MNKETLVPTQMFVGQKEQTLDFAEHFLQSLFCKNSSETQNMESKNCFCSQCQKVKKRQHPFIVWINPTKDYLLDDIKVIFEKTKFALDENQKFFFVLQNAANLNPACANRLLKVLEEPPAGYNFILLTQNENNILPTITSRCLVTHLQHNKQVSSLGHPLLTFFIYEDKLQDPFAFEAELKKYHLSNRQAFELIEQLLNFFTKKISLQLTKNNYENPDIKRWKNIEQYLKNKMKKPPQSGSANLFLKNIFLSFPSK